MEEGFAGSLMKRAKMGHGIVTIAIFSTSWKKKKGVELHIVDRRRKLRIQPRDAQSVATHFGG